MYKSIQSVILPAFLATSLQASPPVIHEEIEILPSDLHPSNYFGTSMAIHNGIIAVSKPSSQPSSLLGAVYLFDSVTGNQLRKITPEKNTETNHFGWAVDMDDNFLAVGPAAYGGTVYVFDASTGIQTATFDSPIQDSSADLFGFALSIDQGTLAVSAIWDSQIGIGLGAVYLYDTSSNLLITELRPTNDDPNEVFGMSVAINDGIVAVGASQQDPITFNLTSAVYLFDAASGEQLHRLEVDQDGGYFGTAVAIENTTLVASSLYEHNGTQFVDAVYVFDIPTGSQTARIESPKNMLHDYFGASIGISDGKIVVGASGVDFSHPDSGSAFVFIASTGEQVATLAPKHGNEDDRFGTAVAIERGVIVAGSGLDDENGKNSGAAYIFDLSCPADLNTDFTLDATDISAFLTAYSATNPLADFTQDGQYDFFDIAAFLTAYTAGCP